MEALVFGGSNKKKSAPQSSRGPRGDERLSGAPANMRGGVQLAVKLLGNVPPVHSPLHLADCTDTPGWNKSRRPRREKAVCRPIRTPARLRQLLVSFMWREEEGGSGGHVYAWPTDPEGLMVPFSASVTGLWNYKSQQWGVGEKNVTTQTRVRVP